MPQRLTLYSDKRQLEPATLNRNRNAWEGRLHGLKSQRLPRKHFC